MAFENFFDANTTSTLNLLLRPLLMLFAHVHDCCGLRTVELLAVKALELLHDLIGSASNLLSTPHSTRLLLLLLIVHNGEVAAAGWQTTSSYRLIRDLRRHDFLPTLDN